MPVWRAAGEPAAAPAPSKESGRPLQGAKKPLPGRQGVCGAPSCRQEDLGWQGARELCELHHKGGLTSPPPPSNFPSPPARVA